MTNKRRMGIGQPAIPATALYGYNILFKQSPNFHHYANCCGKHLYTNIFIYLLLFPYDKFPGGINKSDQRIKNYFLESFYQFTLSPATYRTIEQSF